MSNNDIASVLTIILIVMISVLFLLIFILVFLKIKINNEDKKKNEKNVSSDKTKVQQLYSINSIFNFMEFDKIEDNMIVQKKGKRFVMVIKCRGINYDLMSNMEKAGVEQGFIQYLNSLQFPVQIYIQTKTVDLTGSINTYKEKINTLANNLSLKEFDYNQKVRSGKYDKDVLDKERFEIAKARNLYEYGTDIVSNTERMSLNRNILSKQYYVILSFYPEEAGNDVYSADEVSSIAFSELYTRCQSTISLLSVCGVTGKILDSMELAELLYNAYNRDEAETYSLSAAVNAGYDSLYTTAPDVLDKKMEELDKQIEFDAIQKANEAVDRVRHEREKERKLREKERDYKYIVENMANIILDSNEDMLGKEIVREAKEKISSMDSEDKEELNNDKERNTNKRTGRPRKTA